MIRSSLRLMFMVLIFVAGLNPDVRACIHYDVDYPYAIREGTKYAFLFHDGVNAHLVVRTEVEAEKGILPTSLAWVMPFPSLPSKYEEVDPTVFTELGKIARPELRGDSVGSPVLQAPSSSALRVHAARIVGNYRIQPIEILSKGAGQEFNRWLKKHHFNPMPMEIQKEYMKPGAVFLAIRMNLNGKEAELKPIHIVYRAKTLSFPMKFTHATRTFNLDLFVLTENPIDPKFAEAYHLDWIGKGVTGDAGPSLKALLGNARGTVTLFRGIALNTKGKELSKLATDPMFSPK